MINLVSWLERKKASLCIITAICAISLFVILNSDEKINYNTGGSYVIKMKHYGIDAAEMERSITIPLEDALFAIPGVMSVLGSSENSLSSIFIRFKPGSRGRYEAVRDAAQRVYESLPPSVQRPEIYSSANSRIPVWSAAVTIYEQNTDDSALAARTLEKIVKPKLESLEGAGEVIVSGAGLKEIYIIFDQEKLAVLELDPSAAVSFMGMNDSIFSGGTITRHNKEVIITIDGRYDHPSSALIPLKNGSVIELAEIAEISEREREPDILSRLNGKKTAGIVIMGRDGENLRRLSSAVKKELESLSLPLEFTVLSDLGAEETEAFNTVLNAALLGAAMTAVISLFLNRKGAFSPGVFCSFSIPFICLISIAFLTVCGFSLDRFLLAGIAAGTGTAIDAVILCSERLRKCGNYLSASKALSSLASPLFAGAATTITALIPLFTIADNGVRTIAFSIAVVTFTAFIFSLTLLPPLLLWGINGGQFINHGKFIINHFKKNYYKKLYFNLKQIRQRFARKFNRMFVLIVKFCSHYPGAAPAVSLAVSILAVVMLFAKGADTSVYGSQNSLYAQIEFESGLIAQEVDRLLADYSGHVLEIPGVMHIETGARTGSGTVLISIDPDKTHPHIVRGIAKNIYIPGGFIFFHENALNERYWEISVFGGSDQKCRDIARELAYTLEGCSLIKESVFNFKQGSKKITLLPDREKLAETQIDFSAAASAVRLGVYGPVFYKRMTANEEIDVRAGTKGVMHQSSKEINNLLVSSVQIDSITQSREDTEPSGIKRDNRRRSASITVSTKPMDPRRVKQEISKLISGLDLPPGYSIEFDHEAIKQSEAVSATIISFFMAVIFCYMIIASINESFKIPLLVLSAVPPSLAVPAICIVLSGSAYSSAVACAFIAVSGMTVNAAILCIDGIRTRMNVKPRITIYNVYMALRKKMPALLATTGTTIAGAIPFLFLTEGANSLIRTLSLTGAVGIACSFICSITLIPSILFLSKTI